MRDSDRVDLDLAIIGAQKSASTFVHRCLVLHPQIDIPSAESRHFEDPYYAQGAASTVTRLFGPRRPGVRRGIKRPDYLADPAVPGRLAAAAPALRLVAVLRDPVARAVSAYVHYVRLGFLPSLPLDEAFEQILDGRLARTRPRAADVLGYGRYGEHLSRYLRHFDRDQLLVLRQSDLRRDPVPDLAQLLRFLDVDDACAARLAARVVTANESTYQPMRIRLQRSTNDLRFDYTPDRYRRTPRRMGPLALVAAGSATAVDRYLLAPFDHRAAPRLDPTLAERLREWYAADTELVRTLLDWPAWGEPATAPPDPPS